MNRHITYRTFALRLSACIALLSGLAACTERLDCDTPRAMKLGAGFGDATRATTQVPLDGNKYAMWATATFNSGNASESPYIYFNPNTLKLDYDESSSCYVATKYFYPLSGNMKFAAYASTMSSAPDATFSYDSNKNITKLVVDLCSSDGLQEVVYSDIATVGCPAAATPTLHFHRPQTNLRFSFTPADELTCKHVIINSIQIANVKWRGNIQVTYNNTSGKASHTWTKVGAAGNFKFDIVTEGTVPAEGSDKRMKWDSANNKGIPLEIGDGLHMLPKLDGRTQIIIRYTMLNDPSSTSAGGVGGDVNEDLLGRNEDYRRYLTFVIDADPSNNWEASTQYYYNIKVHGNCQMDVEKVTVKKVEDGPTGTMEI